MRRILLCVFLLSAVLCAKSEDTLSITLDDQAAGPFIADDYLGLSYETRALIPDASGKHYFSPSNETLIRMFRLLGIKSLRIGGNSVDVKGGPIPSLQDVDELFSFARKAGVKVIYSVRLADGDADSAARIAGHIWNNYRAQLAYFAIGNEPSYYKDYERMMKPRYEMILSAMQKAAPGAVFCGPDDNPNPSLGAKLMRDFGPAAGGPLRLVSIHSYPAGCSYRNPFKIKTLQELIPFDPKDRARYLLSDSLTQEYSKIYRQMEPVISRHPYRLTETNSLWYSGLNGASNAYAAAIWGVDYLFQWAMRNNSGMNFHTGDHVGGQSMLAYYAAFVSNDRHGFDVRPLSYALKAFQIGGQGKRMIGTTMGCADRKITAYATKDHLGFVYLTIINKNHDVADAPSVPVSIRLNDQRAPIYSAEYMTLSQSDADIYALSGLHLGQDSIREDGTWNGKWTKMEIEKGTVNYLSARSSVTIIKLCVGHTYTVESSREPMQQGKYKPDWASLKQYEVPQWFQDAKFGIWAHWGPQSVPEYGDWYATWMYNYGSRENKYHVSHYGHPSQVGFKDLIPKWTVRNWDPDRLIKLYKRAGAQYFVTLANHHDNFDLWDSKYHSWNAVNLGPHRNIVAEWEAASRRNGLRFGVSVHASRAWEWYDSTLGSDPDGPMKGVPYDGCQTKEDGKDKWWNGYDPQVLYARGHAVSGSGYTDKNGISTSIPDSSWIEGYYDRTLDLINRYKPDLVYFDDTVLPLWPVSDAGLKIAAHYYNKNMQWHDGREEGVITSKGLNAEQEDCLVRDVERGALNELHPTTWQTCTCLGSWHYDRTRFTKNTYKTALRVVRMLADIVSKNGNLLLSVPIRADGSLDEREEAILDSIADWMAVNKECIFGAHPWRQYGEGPDADEATRLTNAMGFNETKKEYTPRDMRFTQKGDAIYVILFKRPDDGRILVKSLADERRIRRVELLGTGRLPYRCDASGLRVTLPESDRIVPVLKVFMR